MSSPAQIDANRKNAQSSTGPRTPEGKAASSRNAFKFGLTAKDIVLPSEDASAFEALHAALLAQWEPATDGELLLVDDMAAARWRIRRIDKVHTAHMAAAEQSGTGLSEIHLADALRKFQKYAASERRIYESAWRKLTVIQKERKTLELISRQKQESKDRREEVIAAAHRAYRQAHPEMQNEPIPFGDDLALSVLGPLPELPTDFL